MYSTNNNVGKANIVSFPNKDSILQMEMIKHNNNDKSEKANSDSVSNNEAHVSKYKDNNFLLLAGVILSLSESIGINDCLLPLITSILITL